MPASALTLTQTADLSFGALVAGNTLGTVVVSHGGSRSKTGGVLLFAQTLSGVPAVSAAAFSVSGGPANETCTLELPTETTLAKTPSGSMLVTSPVSSTGGTSVTLNGVGAASFTVGATLSVAASQSPGSYGLADFSVTVTCP